MTADTLAPRDRRRVLRVILATQLCLALATAVAVTLFYRHLDANIDAGDDITHMVKKKQKDPEQGEPLNILLLGSDSRDGAGNDIDGKAGIGQRSDTTILVHVSADRQEAYGVSLPRDALVTRPDCTKPDGETVPGGDLEMFNAAFSLGGEACTVAQVEALTGIFIDHYLTVDFTGFKDMVAAVDGVTVCIPTAVDDSAHGITFDAGTQDLGPDQALAYVRERYVLSKNSDIGRMKRQQSFIASMINKVISAGTLSRPDRVVSFLNAATRSIKTDPDLDSVGTRAVLARQFRNTGLSSIEFITVPFEAYAPDPNRLVWTSDANRLWKRINNDKPLSAKFSGSVISADDPVGGAGAKRDGKDSTSPGSDSSASPSPDQAQAAADAAAQAEANGLCA